MEEVEKTKPLSLRELLDRTKSEDKPGKEVRTTSECKLLKPTGKKTEPISLAEMLGKDPESLPDFPTSFEIENTRIRLLNTAQETRSADKQE